MNDELKRMFEAMAAAPDDHATTASYDRQMADLCQRHPNQWALCREDWNGQVGEVRLDVLGPFATQADAVGCWESLPPDDRVGYTVEFLGVPPSAHVLMSSPILTHLPPAQQARS